MKWGLKADSRPRAGSRRGRGAPIGSTLRVLGLMVVARLVAVVAGSARRPSIVNYILY